jgi:hypothetical protein
MMERGKQMSTEIRAIVPQQPEVIALVQTCTELATTSQLERFELVVKARVEAGVADDNELRKVDELLREIVRGSDILEEGTAAAISAAHALHKTLIATIKPWRQRWEDMQAALGSLILKYNAAKREQVRLQQQELNRAAEEKRQRELAEARAKMREGDIAGAKLAMQNASVPAPIISQATPKLDHSSTRNPWQAEITDSMAVIKAIAAGTIPISVVKEWDLALLRKEATKLGGLNWPGVRVWQEERLATSRR